MKVVNFDGLDALPLSRLHNMIDEIEVEIIERRGRDDGRAAGSFVVDGNTDDPQKVLEILILGSEEGDPEIMDKLPSPDFSGQMADSMKWEELLREEGIAYDTELDASGRSDLYDAYNLAFQQGVESKIGEMWESYTRKECESCRSMIYRRVGDLIKYPHGEVWWALDSDPLAKHTCGWN